MGLLELLHAGKVEEFNAARGEGSLDFYAADLSGASMAGANLAGANLENADLSNADLTDANLTRAIMSGADLTGARLGGVMAMRSRWRDAYIGQADLQDADFTGADLTDAEIPNANASFATFLKARMKRTILTGSTLCQADLSESNLAGANLQGSNLEGAILREAHLAGADLSKARLVSADLAMIKATGINLSEADLSGARLPHADLTEANLTNAGVEAADFTRADLSSATLTSVDMDSAIWTDAQIDGMETSVQDEAPELTIFHIEDAQFACRKQSMALAWDNMEPDGKTRLRVIVGTMGKAYDRSPTAIPVPTDLVIAKVLCATEKGFELFTLVERPGGFAAQLFPISPRGKVGKPRRVEIPYTPIARPILTQEDGKLILFGVSREGPGLHVHQVTEDPPIPLHISRLPTARGFVSDTHPVVLTKGGTVFELGAKGPGPQIRTPSGFPGRLCGVAPTEEGMVLAWLPSGGKGIRVSTILPAQTPEIDILLPKRSIGSLQVLADNGMAWAAFSMEGATPAEASSAWAVSLPDGTPFPIVADDRDVNEVHLLPTGKGPLCSVTYLDGTVEVFFLKNGQARSKWSLA
jgi:uncharacterized protein YjbI with pentapeptide repeats